MEKPAASIKKSSYEKEREKYNVWTNDQIKSFEAEHHIPSEEEYGKRLEFLDGISKIHTMPFATHAMETKILENLFLIGDDLFHTSSICEDDLGTIVTICNKEKLGAGISVTFKKRTYQKEFLRYLDKWSQSNSHSKIYIFYLKQEFINNKSKLSMLNKEGTFNYKFHDCCIRPFFQ